VHPSFRYAYEVESARLETFDRCSTMFVSERSAPPAAEAEQLTVVVPAAQNMFGSRRRIRRGLGEGEQTSIGFGYIFPNLIWTLAPDHTSASRSIPLGVDRMLFVRDFFLEAGEEPDAEAWNESNFTFRIQTTKEDVGICEAVQKGLGSRHYQRARYSPKEEAVYHLHTVLRRYLSSGLAERAGAAGDLAS
jgi:phenylpropionate dioxygenase-like ring-hydroxylating dioxygenase large terminal subunit